MSDMNENTSRFYRSRSDRFLGGVCGGIAAYFNVESSLVRLLFVIGSLVWGIGIILYLAAVIIVPEDPEGAAEPPRRSLNMNNTLFWGIAFVALGGVLLLRETGLLNFFYIIDIPWSTVWALSLIAIGIGILVTQSRKKDEEDELEASEPGTALDIDHGVESETPEPGAARDFNFQRSRTNRKLAGICGGIAQHFNIDPSLVRLGWILFTLASKGLGVLIYIIFIFVFPEESPEQAT